MKDFKIGDKVIGVKDVEGNFKTTSKIGTIVNKSYDNLLVQFDTNVGGWGDHGCSLFVSSTDIEPYVEELNNELLFAKAHPQAIIPTKRGEDAGYDVYACFDEEYITIAPHETKLIPTGIATAFSQDYVAIIKERGSTGTKGIGQRCGVIDSGFRSQWFCPITNHNDKPLIIVKDTTTLLESVVKESIVYPYSKAIAQFIMVEVPKLITKEITLEELQSIKSERGLGSIGSSNK